MTKWLRLSETDARLQKYPKARDTKTTVKAGLRWQALPANVRG